MKSPFAARLLMAGALALAPTASALADAAKPGEKRDYYVVDVTKDFATLVDLPSLSGPTDGVARYVEVLIYAEPQSDEKFVILATATEVDCRNKTTRALSDIAYDADMKSLGASQRDGQWQAPPPKSIAAAEIVFVCSNHGDTEHVVHGDFAQLRQPLIRK